MASLKLIIIAIFFLVSIEVNAQTFEVGLIGHQPNVFKLSGTIVISDSTVTTYFNGQEAAQKITNRAGVKIYTTDGTATNSYTITPLSGKLKGFAYDFIINYVPDTRFNNSGAGNFFCRKIN